MEKRCFKCGCLKDLSLFYRHKFMSDGHLNKCMACTRDEERRRHHKKMGDPDWAAREGARQRKKNKKMNHADPVIATARRAVRKLGRSKESHWHHWSYQKPHHTDVIQLTPQNHRKAHRFLIYDQEHLQYRRSDTMELLDTRERHEAFIRHMIATQED